MSNVYKRLRERLSKLGVGYVTTENGVELRVLEQLFSSEDAEMFVSMKDEYESPAEVAARMEADVASVADRMESMAKRGLIFRLREKDKVKYRVIPFFIGIIDFQVNRLNGQLAADVGGYFANLLRNAKIPTHIPLMRSVPVNTNLAGESMILPYDDAIFIINSRERISVANCLCRQTGEVRGNPCKHPMETCIAVDSFADFYVDNGQGRYISKEEAIGILRGNEQRGLVIQVMNSKGYELICSCCSCHCCVLMLLKVSTDAARNVVSNYIRQVDVELCNHCGICANRCPVRACKRVDDRVEFKDKLCIGCGLCVSTCPTNAMRLVQKPKEKLYTPADTIFDTYEEMKKA